MPIAYRVENRRQAKITYLAAEHRKLKEQCRPLESNLKAVVERAALLVNCATRRLDDAIGVGEVEQRMPVLGETLLGRAASDDAAGHAKHQPDEVGVVDVQIEQRRGFLSVRG